jgi:S-phase kinase-associated protein 1
MILVTADARTFEVEAAIARQAHVLANLMEDVADGPDAPDALRVTLPPHVTGDAVAVVLAFMRRAATPGAAYDADWAANMAPTPLCDAIQAAHFLHFQPFVNAAVQQLARLVRDKTPQQIRETFGIETEEDEEEEEEEEEEQEEQEEQEARAAAAAAPIRRAL